MPAVRQECRLFAILALGLLITTQHLGYYMAIAYRLQPSQIIPLGVVHYAGALGFALLLPFLFSSRLSASVRLTDSPTGMGELGLSLKPSKDLPLSFDLGVQGYVGKRQGVTGSLQIRYEF